MRCDITICLLRCFCDDYVGYELCINCRTKFSEMFGLLCMFFSAKVFLTNGEYKDLCDLCTHFQFGDGKLLQEKLTIRAKKMKNWVIVQLFL